MNKTFSAILVEGIMRNISMKLFCTRLLVQEMSFKEKVSRAGTSKD